jgi:membrane-bound metal-dependent hydrolase YbcI (DUF457 family)
MLPPGHIAAGYLVAKAVLEIGHPSFSSGQTNTLLFLGAFFAFAPDLDFLYLLFTAGRFTTHDEDPSHREFISHAPILWCIAGLLIYFLGSSLFIKYIGLLLWLCSWSHFALDTIIPDGVMWAWPFNKKTYTFVGRKETKTHITEKRFIPFWLEFIQFYATKMALSFYIEIGLLILAAFVFLR